MVGFIPMCSALLVFLMAFKVASAHQPSSEYPSSTTKKKKDKMFNFVQEQYVATNFVICLIKFIYSEKATKILRNLHLFLTDTTYSQKKVEIS